MDLTLCLSSRLTSELLTARNPQGKEAGWVDRAEDRGNLVLFLGRVVTAELGCAVLLATATVETFVYGTLGLVSLCFYWVNSEPARKLGKLASSSAFTILWNIGNVIVFNPGCINCVTHESFARYSMDHWTRGEVLKLVVLAAECFLNIFSRHRYHGLPLTALIMRIKYTRLEDSLHIADWAQRHRGAPDLAEDQRQTPAVIANAQLRLLQEHGRTMNAQIAAGKEFIETHILAEGKVDAPTRNAINAMEPAALLFLLSRAVYLYSFGELKEEVIPDFFAEKTQVEIRKLRDRPLSPAVTNLDAFMGGMDAYNRGPSRDDQLALFTQIRGIGYADQQEGLLIGRCLQRALEEAAA